MTEDKNPLIFLKHILDSIKNIEDFVKGVDEKSFLLNKEKQSAVIRQIEIIGEAVKNLPIKFRDKYSNIPWIKISGMRDKLMHHYFGVDLKVVWESIKEDIPKLKKEIQIILDKEN